MGTSPGKGEERRKGRKQGEKRERREKETEGNKRGVGRRGKKEIA